MVVCAFQKPASVPSSGAQVVCVDCWGRLHVHIDPAVRPPECQCTADLGRFLAS